MIRLVVKIKSAVFLIALDLMVIMVYTKSIVRGDGWVSEIILDFLLRAVMTASSWVSVLSRILNKGLRTSFGMGARVQSPAPKRTIHSMG